jgi:FAD/FMN-containing dehydrogenase
MPPSHPALRIHTDAEWRDVHSANDAVSCTRYEIAPTAAAPGEQLLEVGGALRAVLDDAFSTGAPLRTPGGRWSLSNIGRPQASLLDLANYRRIGAVSPSWLVPAALARLQAAGVSPVLVAASMTVNAVNRELLPLNLALQTSGASDGQTLAGATATGTHGADVRVGALHDTLLAVHLVVSPTLSVLIQPNDGSFTGRAADTLGAWFGIPCTLMSDDRLFRAACVHLGSLGVVLNVIVAAVPLYYLVRQRSPHRDDDPRWRAVLADRRPSDADTSHPENPDYLQLLLNPYPPVPTSDPRAWVLSMQKLPFHGQAGITTRPTDVSLKSDLTDFLPGVVHLLQDGIELPENPVLRAITTAQFRSLYGTTVTSVSALPGAMFGPPDLLGIDLAPLRGASAEYVFDAGRAALAVDTILNTLGTEANRRRQLLGGIGVRFVRGSNAWLAPNNKPVSCFVELQSLYTSELYDIHTAITAALVQAQIPYGGHWGQWALNTPAVVQSWWGAEAVAAWRSARAELLPTPGAQAIFASPILEASGLAG